VATWIKFAGVIMIVALAVSVGVAWKGQREQRAALQAQLNSAQKALADATARQASRDTAVNKLLAELKKTKAEVQKPAQVIAALPNVLPLPQPVTLEQGRQDTRRKVGNLAGKSTGADGVETPPSPPGSRPAEANRYQGLPTAEFPAVDLKPLYDFAVDCKSCQAQLAAAQADLKDEQAKAQALGRERDDALKAAKGGSVFGRVVRAARWFAIGAAAGAIAAKATR
jgi:hypothetical protein